MDLYQLANIPLNSSIQMEEILDSHNFGAPWPIQSFPFLTMSTQNLIRLLLTFLTLYQQAKNQLN